MTQRLDPSRPFDDVDRLILLRTLQPSPLRRIRSRAVMLAFLALASFGAGWIAAALVM